MIRQNLIPYRLVDAVIMAGRIIDLQFLISFNVWVRIGHCREERFCIWMQRMTEQFLALCQFQNTSLVDDRNSVRDETDNTQVMRNKEIRQSSVLLQFIEKIQHLRTD